jgi:hypothetical protein
MQKRLRAAQRNNYALETGERPFSKTPLGAGQLRARARLMEQRRANDLRLNEPKVSLAEKLIGAGKAFAHLATEAAASIADAVAVDTGVTEVVVETPKRVRKPKAEVAAIAEANAMVLEKKLRKVGVRNKSVEGV